ncbi:MAG: hypothetical protein COA85_03215 [Robiginitomaculum sp.]|nr:MAG: hypothetical protein COA85_03215 [Robiginitomaculum sp.]
MELRRHNKFSESFAFVSECLRQSQVALSVYPDQDRDVAVAVTLEPDEEGNRVTELWINGNDLLDLTKVETNPDGSCLWQKTTVELFKDELSEQLAVPMRQLTVTYTKDIETSMVYVPHGWLILH